MKYTIEGFSQQKLVEYGLDTIDALILRWFVDFQPKMMKIYNDEKDYCWVKYQAIIDDLPILGITNREIVARRFNKFIKCNIMEKLISKDGGVFIGFRLTTNYLTLVDTPIDSKVDTPIDSKVDTKYSSIKKDSSIKEDSSIKYSLKNKQKENIPSANASDCVNEIYEYWNEKTKQNLKGDKQIIKSLETILKDYTLDDIKKVIDYMILNPWFRQSRNLAISVLARTNKFGEKLDKALIYQNEKPQQSTSEALHRCNSLDFSINDF